MFINGSPLCLSNHKWLYIRINQFNWLHQLHYHLLIHLPLLQNQNVVHQPYQAGPSTQYHQMLGPQTQNSLVSLQQLVSGIIYSQAGVPFYGMSQTQPGYTYQLNPIYSNLGYSIGGQTPWHPQAQLPQTSFQQVSYPGFGQ